MCPNFVYGCAVACPLPCFKEAHYALKQSPMVVVVPRMPGAWLGMLVSDGLEAGEGIGEYTDPVMVHECDESRVNGDEFRPHDGAGLFRPGGIYKYGGGGWDVYHRRS